MIITDSSNESVSFGWIKFEESSLPLPYVIRRDTKKYLPYNPIKQKILSQYDPHARFEFENTVRPFKSTLNEAYVLNEAYTTHLNLIDLNVKFSAGDILVELDEFFKFYGYMKKRYKTLIELKQINNYQHQQFHFNCFNKRQLLQPVNFIPRQQIPANFFQNNTQHHVRNENHLQNLNNHFLNSHLLRPPFIQPTPVHLNQQICNPNFNQFFPHVPFLKENSFLPRLPLAPFPQPQLIRPIFNPVLLNQMNLLPINPIQQPIFNNLNVEVRLSNSSNNSNQNCNQLSQNNPPLPPPPPIAPFTIDQTLLNQSNSEMVSQYSPIISPVSLETISQEKINSDPGINEPDMEMLSLDLVPELKTNIIEPKLEPVDVYIEIPKKRINFKRFFKRLKRKTKYNCEIDVNKYLSNLLINSAHIYETGENLDNNYYLKLYNFEETVVVLDNKLN